MNNHVDKVCCKSFPCGRSLGGHMKTHMMDIDAAQPEAEIAAVQDTVKLTSLIDYSDDEEDEEEEIGEEEEEEDNDDDKDSLSNENGDYDMRESFNKGRGEAGVEKDLSKKFVCVKCGKGFQSLKAMCGHMACHSEKDRNFSNLEHQRNGGTSSWAKQKVVMDSHSDTETGVAAAGSNLRRRSRRVKVKNTVVVPPKSNAGCNSSYLLRNGGSGSDSVVENETEEVARSLMMLSRDSGYWGGVNSVGESSDLSVKMEDGSRFKACDASLGMRLKRGRSVAKSKLFKELRNKSSTHEVWDGSSQKFGSVCTNVDAGRTYIEQENMCECLVCDMVFPTHLALVKHTEGSMRSAESDENSVETDMSPPMPDLRKGKAKIEKAVAAKRTKHECPVCFKIFKSGQAMGGHKRIHLAGGSEEFKPRNEQLLPVPDSSQAHSCIDLNQPAPLEEDHLFMPW